MVDSMSTPAPGLRALPLSRRLRVRALALLARRLAGATGPAALGARRRAPAWLRDPVRRALAPLRVAPPHPARLDPEELPAPAPPPAGAPRATVIVASRGARTLEQCLRSVRAHTRVPHEVVVVDDDAPTPLAARVGDLGRVRRLIGRRGFVGAANQGAREAGTEVLVFLNDDAVVTPGWLGEILEALSRPRVGLVGPASNDTGDAATSPADYRDLEGLLAHARRCAGEPREVPKLSLLCAAIRRADFEAIGGLDEGYGLGMFEDDELCRQLRRRRLRVLLAPRAYVHHHGSRTFAELDPAERIARFEINRYRFERRWGARWRAPV